MTDTIIRRILKRLAKLEQQINMLLVKTARSEVTGGVSRRATADLPTTDIAGQIYFVTDATRPDDTTGDLQYNDGSGFLSVHSFASVAQFTVAGLPAGGTTQNIALATDGRKPAEGVGAGTGMLVFYDGTAWRSSADGTTIQA